MGRLGCSSANLVGVCRLVGLEAGTCVGLASICTPVIELPSSTTVGWFRRIGLPVEAALGAKSGAALLGFNVSSASGGWPAFPAALDGDPTVAAGVPIGPPINVGLV